MKKRILEYTILHGQVPTRPMVWNIFPFICASTIFVIPKISWISAWVWYVQLIFELLLIGIVINKGMRWFYVVTYLSHSWCQTPTCDMETGNACFEYFILLKKNSCNFGKNEIWKRNPCQDKTAGLALWQSVANRHHFITRSHGKDVEFYCWHPEMNRQRIQMYFYDFESLY